MIRIEHAPDGILECRVSGTLGKADYEAAVPELERAIESAEGPLRLMIRLEDFHGWDMAGLWEELRFDLRHRDDLGRVAVLGESRVEEWLTRLSKPFFDAPVRYFAPPEVEAARAWLLEDRIAGKPTPATDDKT